MLLALGCDHRGLKVAMYLVSEVLFPTAGPFLDDSSLFDTKHDFLKNCNTDNTFIGNIFQHERIADQEMENDSTWSGALLISGDVAQDGFGFHGTQCKKLDSPKYLNSDTGFNYISSNTPTLQIDYPDIAAAIAEKVKQHEVDLGILIGGTGIGMSIVANKFRGVRAAVCYSEITAELSRKHNNANVLCLPGEILGCVVVKSIIKKWLTTQYEGGRHQHRLDKIEMIEEKTGL